jgi:GntR family transcriptional regulator, transcriptional repressor for pyruvate dehydrogenase complex
MSSENVRQLGRKGATLEPDGENWGALAQPPRLGDHLSTRIAELIGRGDFDHAGRLPSEIVLANRFGVSRPVVREALSHLRSMGFIVSRKGSGSYVRKPSETASHHVGAVGFGPVNSLAEVRKCYEFRIGLESEAAYYAAQNRTPEALAAMREALKRMEEAISRGLVGMSADLEFHMAVARGSENEFFEAVMQSMRMPIEFAINLARSLTLTRPLEHLRAVQTEHVTMFEAIEARDKDAARLAMRTHIEDACMRIFEGPGSNASRTGEPKTMTRFEDVWG